MACVWGRHVDGRKLRACSSTTDVEAMLCVVLRPFTHLAVRRFAHLERLGEFRGRRLAACRQSRLQLYRIGDARDRKGRPRARRVRVECEQRGDGAGAVGENAHAFAREARARRVDEAREVGVDGARVRVADVLGEALRRADHAGVRVALDSLQRLIQVAVRQRGRLGQADKGLESGEVRGQRDARGLGAARVVEQHSAE